MKESIARSGVDPKEINYVTVGTVLPTDSRYAYVSRVASIPVSYTHLDVYKRQVLESAGLVSRSREAQRRPVPLEASRLAEMTEWIERYQRRAEERYGRLDAVLTELARPAGSKPEMHHQPRNPLLRRDQQGEPP